MVVRAGPLVLISSLAHGALVVLAADELAVPKWCLLGPAPKLEPAPPTMSEPTATTSEPIEVAFLEPEREPEPAVRPSRIGSARAAVARTATTSNATESSTSTSTSTSTSEPRTSEPGTSLFRMRGSDLRLDGGTADRIASAGPPAAPPDEPRKSGRLESQPGGRAIVYDRVTTMTVDPDGKAHLDDIPDIDVKFHLPIPKLWEVDEIRKEAGHELAEWFKDPEAGKRYGRTQDLPRHLQASPGACDSWGSVMCDDPLAPAIEQRVRERKKVQGGFLGGAADITAYLHRKFVGDPYSSRKLELLDDTRDERVAMGTKYRAQQRVRSAEYMQRNLDTLWARESRPLARRAALFELWDECADDDAGTRARTIVIGWIRTHLPAGSEHAYTAEELAALNTHRASTVPFEPYAN